MFIRNAYHKFKADFDEASNLTIPSPNLRSDTMDDESRYRAFNPVLREPSRDDLPAIPFESADEGDFNDHEAVSPLQQRSLFQSLQYNPSLSSNTSLPSIESGTSSRAPDSSKSTKQTPTLGAPMGNEFAKVSSLLNTKKKKTKDSFSPNNSSILSIHSKHPESFQHPPKPKCNEFAKVSALLAQKSTKPKDTYYDTVNDFGKPMKRPTDLLSIASKSPNGHGVSSMPQVKEMPKSSSNSKSDSAEVVVYPMEVTHPFSSNSVSRRSYDMQSVTQTSQSHDDSVIQTSLLAVIIDDDQQHTSETNRYSDPTPITQSPPLTSRKLPEREPNSIVKELSVPEGIPLDTPSTSPNVQSLPQYSTFPDSNPISPKDDNPVQKVEARRKPISSMNSFLLNLAIPQVAEVPDKVEPPKTPWRPPLRSLQRINESGDSDDFTPDDLLAQRMEELGRIRRMESRSLMAQSKTSPEKILQQPNRTATSKTELRPQLQTLQAENSSDVAALLREAYVERQKTLQTQLDKALAELRDAQAENKRLTSENQCQQRSISQLKIALDEAKREQDHSLTQIQNQLRDTTSSLSVLNKEKKGWQDKLDSMQHKLTAAERQVRCLDHLTRHKLESRQETGYGQPKRRGLFASTPASTDVIALVRALNEEIYQTCVQLVEGLEYTTIFSTKHKPQVQKVLGDHLTAMMEDQAIKVTGVYNMLLMQTVLEVFMTHWCSSIIEAFYPQQESFADLLVQLSATQTTRTSGSTTICGKQIQIVQSSAPDTVKFNEWVQDIIKELGHFLTTAGLRMRTQRAPLFSTKTLALVKVSYDLRTALAEKDICGGLEIVIVPPDTPFQEKWMIDAHADPRKVDTDQSHVDFVVGTSGIGLQRKVSETVQGQFQSRMEVELKPKVVLARALKD